ncbi:MAG: RNA polymerase sigma factor [Chloroflexota bacterium]
MQRELVEQAMSGDHAAFSELARNSAGRLLVLARLILHDDAAAEDATQEALVAAWRHIKGLRDPDRFDAWLHRLLVNECHREARGRHSRRTHEIHIPAFDAPEPDGVDSLLDRDQLDRGFRRLDVDHRVVLVLYYYLGLRPEEAAEMLGLPPGTVRSRLHRAMQAMRAALEADARTRSVEEGGRA